MENYMQFSSNQHQPKRTYHLILAQVYSELWRKKIYFSPYLSLLRSLLKSKWRASAWRDWRHKDSNIKKKERKLLITMFKAHRLSERWRNTLWYRLELYLIIEKWSDTLLVVYVWEWRNIYFKDQWKCWRSWTLTVCHTYVGHSYFFQNLVWVHLRIKFL